MIFKKKKIQEYMIVSESSPRNVEEEVSKLLSDGWELVGGVSYMQVKNGGNQYDRTLIGTWSQAMVKYG